VYEKTIPDHFGDPVVVTLDTDDTVALRVTDCTRGGATSDATLTPDTARRVARALKRAANVAEGKPAKAKKPRTIVDGHGDRWSRNADGTYTMHGAVIPELKDLSLARIRERYGIQDEG
jgi:hypothetical protein